MLPQEPPPPPPLQKTSERTSSSATAMAMHTASTTDVELGQVEPTTATIPFPTGKDANADGDETWQPDYHRHPPKTRKNLHCCVRFGRTWVLYSCAKRYGYFPMTAHVGPHWPFMLVTYALSIGPIVLVLVNDKFSMAFRTALIASSILTTVVFSMVACSDPGVIYESMEPLTRLQQPSGEAGEEAEAMERGGVICAHCQIRRPKTASHCSDCGVCVNKLDHHCPWTGKCIGKRTLWLFYAFIWCISIHLVLLSVGTTLTYLSNQ